MPLLTTSKAESSKVVLVSKYAGQLYLVRNKVMLVLTVFSAVVLPIYFVPPSVADTERRSFLDEH